MKKCHLTGDGIYICKVQVQDTQSNYRQLRCLTESITITFYSYSAYSFSHFSWYHKFICILSDSPYSETHNYFTHVQCNTWKRRICFASSSIFLVIFVGLQGNIFYFIVFVEINVEHVKYSSVLLYIKILCYLIQGNIDNIKYFKDFVFHFFLGFQGSLPKKQSPALKRIGGGVGV